MELGIVLALGCAGLANVAMLCKHRGAVDSPDVRFSAPLASARGLFRSKWWTIGFIIAFVSWGLHVAALAVAPLSLVQTVIAGGLVLLVLPAKRWFGITIGRREMAGLSLSAIGLAFLALTATPQPDVGGYSHTGMAIFEGAAISLGLLLMFSGSRGGSIPHRGLLLGASAGTLLGVSDVALKALADTVPSNIAAIATPWTLVALAGSIAAFFALARSLQVGNPVEVIVVSSVAGNVAAIVGGVYVFGDVMGADTVAIAMRSAAFAAVIGAAALVPAAPRSDTAPVPA